MTAPAPDLVRPRAAVIRLALTILKRLQAAEAEYAEYVAEMAAEGYRPQYCRHGVNVWANDFDGACYRCEDEGLYPDLRRLALDEAEARSRESRTRYGKVIEAIALGIPLDMDTLSAWARQPITGAAAGAGWR